MESLYHAYLSFEQRVERGEFSTHHLNSKARSSSLVPVQSRLGDWLIRAGLKLKRRSISGKPMAWTPLTGNKP